MDRRINKSKRAIMDALLRLISEKSFESITINEIANEADVNRGTVYLHFEDKYDLLNQCIDSQLNPLLQTCQANNGGSLITSKEALLRTFSYLETHAAFYTLMMKDNSIPIFRTRLLALMQESLGQQLANKDDVLPKDITVQFIASAAVGVMEWWLSNEMPKPAADMVEHLNLLLERVSPNPQPAVKAPGAFE